MSPFKPKHTFESVVCELVAGLEDGTVVLSKAVGVSKPEKQIGAVLLFYCSFEMRMKATPSLPRAKSLYKFVNEWVRVDLDTVKDLPIDFDSSISAPTRR
jgi:hypothetical protein